MKQLYIALSFVIAADCLAINIRERLSSRNRWIQHVYADETTDRDAQQKQEMQEYLSKRFFEALECADSDPLCAERVKMYLDQGFRPTCAKLFPFSTLDRGVRNNVFSDERIYEPCKDSFLYGWLFYAALKDGSSHAQNAAKIMLDNGLRPDCDKLIHLILYDSLSIKNLHGCLEILSDGRAFEGCQNQTINPKSAEAQPVNPDGTPYNKEDFNEQLGQECDASAALVIVKGLVANRIYLSPKIVAAIDKRITQLEASKDPSQAQIGKCREFKECIEKILEARALEQLNPSA
jgi:hypothetical protein